MRTIIPTNQIIDTLIAPTKPQFETIVPEETENKKKAFALSIAKEIINTFSPEDSFDIFNSIRNELQKELQSIINKKGKELEIQVNYFENLKQLIY